MVQVLPYVPGFGEKLGQAFGGAIGEFGKAYQQKQAQNALEKMEGIGAESGQKDNSPMSAIQRYNMAVKAYGPDAAKIYANSFIEQQKIASKEAVQNRQRNLERTSKLVEKTAEKNIGKRDQIQKQNTELKRGLQAVETGDVGGFDINYFANLLPPDVGAPLKNLSGVQLESAMKNLLIEGIQKTSGRPNQWIEQQIKSASASIGKSVEANTSIIKAQLASNSVEEKLIDVEDDLLAQYDEQGLAPPANLNKLVHELVKPYAEQLEDQLAYDLRVQYEKSKGPNSLKSLQKVPQGTPLTKEKRDALLEIYKGNVEDTIINAKKLGYSIPKVSPIAAPQTNEMALSEGQ